MKKFFTILASAIVVGQVNAQALEVSMPVPNSETKNGLKVLTFIAKDPPGQRCNGNIQVAAEVANNYIVPIQLLPSTLAPGLPAPAVFYGKQMIVADGKDFNGAASYQMVADVLDVENVPKQAKSGLITQGSVRRDFESLKSSIKTGNRPLAN